MQYLESALKHGSPFEAFSLYAAIHAATARRPLEQGGKPGFCGAAVAWYKLVSERGSWNDNYLLDAEKAWARGEEELAMVGWFVAGEMGSEAAQNNLAYLLDRGTGKQVLFGREGTNGTTSVKSQGRVNEMAMRWWIRSAAQDNVDAMVKVGDYYCMSKITPRIRLLTPRCSTSFRRDLFNGSGILPDCSRYFIIFNGILEPGLDV
jgi:SEL1 protein